MTNTTAHTAPINNNLEVNMPAPIIIDAEGALVHFDAPVPADLMDYDLYRDLRQESSTAVKIQMLLDYDRR